MKKLLLTTAKAIIFFIGWAVCAGLMPVPSAEAPAIWRLWAEAIPFAIIVVFTLLFWLLDRKHFRLHIFDNAGKNAVFGLLIGVLWLTLTGMGALLFGKGSITGSNPVPLLAIWIFAVFLNVCMQELLVRGYLYRLIEANYNIAAAAVFTTLLFTLMHGGAFEAGIIPVLNVFTMSILMTLVMVYTGSLAAPIMMHFVWNCIGSLILGGVSLADDYPQLLNMSFSGNEIFSGGKYELEGSLICLIVNLFFCAVFAFAIRRKIIIPLGPLQKKKQN